MAGGQTRHGGYGSDAEYRAAIAAEVETMQQASDAMQSKPMYGTELAREAAPTDDLLLEATGKLSQALGKVQGDLDVNAAYQTLEAMLEGSSEPESAALAVIAFASQHPEYSTHAVEAMEEMWGDHGTLALEQAVHQIATVEAEQEFEAAQRTYDEHVSKRADVIRDLSNQIAQRDGEDVRQVTASLSSQDETLLYGDDVDAAAALLGYRQLAKAGKASAMKEGFLQAFDREVEANGLGGRLYTDEEKAQFAHKQAQANAQIIDFSPQQSFERGHTDALRRVRQSVVGLPFDENAFNEEAAKYDTPSHATVEAIKARDRREEAEHVRRFGEPRPQE
jgi:hypothetical protein